MTRLLAGRAVQSAVVLLLVSFAVYGLMGLMPGDPVDLMLSSNPHLTSADVENLRRLYGVDRPILERYGRWLSAALQGDFGYSRLYARPVPEVLLPALRNTVLLLGSSFALSFTLALVLGVLAASRSGGPLDRCVNLIAFSGTSVPSFWLALLLILVFAVGLGWLPASGVSLEGAGGWQWAKSLLLPAANITILSLGPQLRYVRASMLETLRLDFIRTARAKGVGERRILWVHALRNALIPIITVVALEFGTIFSGALVTETMFAIPGMGRLIFDSVMGNDYNLALVALLFATALTLFMNLVADLLYAWADPRVSLR
ncbi:MAG: ABC transporter permease [Deltaproteobacteria bacterium]|nr:ABC transporter permease [Deltaproteobacteria bacterium]